MPLYTFRCRKCGSVTQVVHEFGEPHPESCAHILLMEAPFPREDVDLNAKVKTQVCGGQFDRIFDVPNIVYRDSGFYTVDKRLTPVLPEDYNPDED